MFDSATIILVSLCLMLFQRLMTRKKLTLLFFKYTRSIGRYNNHNNYYYDYNIEVKV